jgi:hypothetical protein
MRSLPFRDGHVDVVVVAEGADGGTAPERRAVYWAITRSELAGLADRAGLLAARREEPADTGFFQPLLRARA